MKNKHLHESDFYVTEVPSAPAPSGLLVEFCPCFGALAALAARA
jgi:hypothetical protein